VPASPTGGRHQLLLFGASGLERLALARPGCGINPSAVANLSCDRRKCEAYASAFGSRGATPAPRTLAAFALTRWFLPCVNNERDASETTRRNGAGGHRPAINPAEMAGR
jgi:hypothetical protein